MHEAGALVIEVDAEPAITEGRSCQGLEVRCGRPEGRRCQEKKHERE
jgi:hypothetical protein